MKNIAVDARPLSYGMTGNSRYLFEALKVLRERNSFNYTLYSNRVVIEKKPGPIWLHLRIPKVIREDQNDLFWGTLQLLPWKKLKIPECVNFHDLNFISAPETMTRSNYWQHRFFSPLTIKNADRIFCLSKNTELEIGEFRPQSKSKLKTVYPGVIRVKRSAIQYKEKYGNYIFSVGTLEPRKNIYTIVESYLILKKENPSYPLNLVIAGRIGWGEAELTKKLLSGELEKSGIFFIQKPSEEDLSSLYEDSEAFAFPSLHEGFGLPLIEAQIAQKICIASDIRVFKEILSPNSDIFVSPKSISDWVSAFKKIETTESRKRKSKFDASLWTWEKTAINLENEFENLLGIKT
jgi:glycosyltransferase involved in cell wall biosynthesis